MHVLPLQAVYFETSIFCVSIVIETSIFVVFPLQAVKGSGRFRYKGLQNEDNLSIMFEDLRNTGDDHWGPSSGVAPSQAIPLDDDDENEGENEDDSDPDEVTPSARPKRGKSQGNAKGKKTKTSGGQWFQEQMDKLVEMNERTTASCESIARGEDKSGSTIQEVMALVKGCGAKPGSNEHFIATVVFTKKAEREMCRCFGPRGLQPTSKFVLRVPNPGW